MSRYIEEEAIIKAIDESGQRYGITTANQCNFKEIVRKTPTADVAPKSEVYKLHEVIFKKEDLMQKIAKERNDYYDELQYAKQEVAREIFEEIDKIRIMEKCCQKVGICYDTASEYEELKKKYTEGNQEPEIKKRCPDCKYFVGCETACGGVPCDLYDEGDEK